MRRSMHISGMCYAHKNAALCMVFLLEKKFAGKLADIIRKNKCLASARMIGIDTVLVYGIILII